ncbi:hypothetical protein [Sorangium sp. So ce233]|uniref:hypothetical protein n=1 Tax=Sorangium sp. So ce233 TaxID=3133290 RepID=UPI003F627022
MRDSHTTSRFTVARRSLVAALTARDLLGKKVAMNTLGKPEDLYTNQLNPFAATPVQ